MESQIRSRELREQASSAPAFDEGASSSRDTVRSALRSMGYGQAQAKLRVTTPGDTYEQEADATAERVVGQLSGAAKDPSRAPSDTVSPSPAAKGSVRAPESGALSGSGGSPLAEHVRAPMEKAFGADFGSVRVHTGSEAAAKTDALGARALTSGRDIYFGSGGYDPGSAGGQKLLAHELTHTLQQGSSNRVAGWWKDSHREITLASGQRFIDDGLIDAKIVNWVARKAGSQDETARSWGNFVTSLAASFFAKKHFQRLRHSARKKGDLGEWKNPKDRERAEHMWDNLGFHLRWPIEKKYHGEAGGYVRDNGATANAGAVEAQIDKAARFYISGKYREGLLQLADGLHSAEDRGSHGEGKPYTGHDPRLTMPEKFDGTHNPHYLPGWDCDNPAINTGGRAIGEQYARQGWALFYNKVRNIKSTREKLAGGKRGRVRPGGVKSKFLKHGFRVLLTPITEGVAQAKQPKESKLKNIGGYDKVKLDHPDPENPSSDPMANMLPIYKGRMLESAGAVRSTMDGIYDTLMSGKSSPGKATYEKLRDTCQELMVTIQQTPELASLKPLALTLGRLSIKAEEWRRRSSGMHRKSTKRKRNDEIMVDLRFYSRRIKNIIDRHENEN